MGYELPFNPDDKMIWELSEDDPQVQIIPPIKKSSFSLNRIWFKAMGYGALGLTALGVTVIDNIDVRTRSAASGRSGWEPAATIAVSGRQTPLSWRFWDKAAPQPQSYIITTDNTVKAPANTQLIKVERRYEAFYTAARIAQSLDDISRVDAEAGKSIPGLEGMDGKLGTEFNGGQLFYGPGEKTGAVAGLEIAGRASLELEQKWNGVQVTRDWWKCRYYDLDMEYRNWRAQKMMKTEIAFENLQDSAITAVNAARTEIADWIRPASPSAPESGSRTSSAPPARSPQ